MEEKFSDRLMHAWNAFKNKDPTTPSNNYYSSVSNINSYGHSRSRLSGANESSIISAIFNRIALDVSAIDIRHVRNNEEGQFLKFMKSSLNDCLTLNANIDQTGRTLIHDVVLSMLDEGTIAIVPIETSVNPKTGAFNIFSLRVGKIIDWYPRDVKMEVYNDITGTMDILVMPKQSVAIVENPLHSVINGNNSTFKRLVRKLSILDAIDEQNGSGKLDLIVGLPYVIRNEARKLQAEERRSDIEKQLKGSKYGIAYTDGTEKITQLNRPVENNMLKQVEYLTNMVYSQIGITTSILDGTADSTTMLNYYNRTIEPIITAIVEAFQKAFLTQTARSQNQSISFFSDPFKLVPLSELSDVIDTLSRNQIMSANEFRSVIGRKPSDDPTADALLNKNIKQNPEDQTIPQEEEFQNE